MPVVAASAFKHGLSAKEILHAYRNPIRAWDLGEGFTMTVGGGTAGDLLEIGCVTVDSADVIVHAMPARQKFLR